jgi:hypothetical protein
MIREHPGDGAPAAGDPQHSTNADALPLLTLAVTVPMVGNPLKRAPLDPFLILLAAAGVSTIASALRGRAKPATAPAMVKG